MISKSEVLSKLAAEDEAAFKALEVKIDMALTRHDRRTMVGVNGVSSRVIAEVKKEYVKGGWQVDYTDVEQRDGAFLTFT